MSIKVSDYIVEYLIKQGVTDVFGYPGGMITYLMDSLGKYSDKINTHITYHEQAAAFAACGYAQASRHVGVAFATSGPGATNLVTGIGQAYFDSIPVIFITGQVNTYESSIGQAIRQKGFQETDIVSIVKPITKDAIYINDASEVKYIMQKAFSSAMSDRKGPVLLDIPMNILKADVDSASNTQESPKPSTELDDYSIIAKSFKSTLAEALKISRRPCLLIGNGIKISNRVDELRNMLRNCPIPVVSSIMAVDIVPETQGLEGIFYGFIGAYGNRTANFTVAKCDLLICLGSRLDVRQVGANRKSFASNAQIIRVDIDKSELDNRTHDDEVQFQLPLSEAVPILGDVLSNCESYENWLNVCKEIKSHIKLFDEREPNRFVNQISKLIPDSYSITADVGQNMIWVAQSFKFKPYQRVFLSGGMGTMGYALPAAIGVWHATHKPVMCFVGDGGLQMNIQELQYIFINTVPIKVFVMNNSSLGMIRHFQEMYFDSRCFYTVNDQGYSVPNFVKIANAYGISAKLISSLEEISELDFIDNKPELFEVKLSNDTVVVPKLEFGKPNQDQEPLIDRTLYQYLMEL